jgi:DNA-binding LacI/PurR family transcriptional regulator
VTGNERIGRHALSLANVLVTALLLDLSAVSVFNRSYVRVTIDEVARVSGVSVATVSRAIRGLPNVSPHTRDRVMAAVAELDYRPDPNAARLAAGRTGVVSLVAPSITTWYTGQAMAGVEAALAGSYELSVVLLPDLGARRRFLENPATLAKRCDGVILLDLCLDMVGGEAVPGFPIVSVGTVSTVTDSVTIDNVAGGRMAGEHLAALGHHRVGVIAGAAVDDAAQVSAPRLEGCRQALAAVGVELPAELVGFGNFSAVGGSEVMQGFLRLPAPPTAVFALSDEMAMGAMWVAKEAGVGTGISYVGFDDHDLAFTAGLTTIAQDPGALGALGARLILDRLGGLDAPPRNRVIDIHLVERTSTGPPK